MSKMHMANVKCPKCGKESEFTVWDSVNTQLDPSFKEKARTGELFRFTCPDCGSVTSVMFQCLYHQMEDQVMIYFIPNGPVDEAVEVFTKKEGMLPMLDVGYTKRIVTSYNDFLEKLKILDENLDDKALEIMKVIMLGAIGQNEPGLAIKAMYLDKDKDGRLFFAILKEDGGWVTTTFSKNLYDSVTATFKDIISEDKEVIIDHDWAMRCMMRDSAQGE